VDTADMVDMAAMAATADTTVVAISTAAAVSTHMVVRRSTAATAACEGPDTVGYGSAEA
jgi:hypothetical protein